MGGSGNWSFVGLFMVLLLNLNVLFSDLAFIHVYGRVLYKGDVGDLIISSIFSFGSFSNSFIPFSLSSCSSFISFARPFIASF